MALKFGPQWLRDLSDGGTAGPSQPPTPTLGGKFKLAEYRYGREEMLALYNDSSPPPDQVRKHQSIFSKENQKPVAMSPLTEDEQRLMSQGFNSTVVLRAAVRGSAPPLRGRGGGTADRGRGRGRGRGEGYISRTLENGDPGYSRSTQDGWEHVGRKFERSFSRGYDDPSVNKREFLRSSSDNWRDKRPDDDKEDGSWRTTRDNTRWGPTRSNWRESQQDYMSYEDRRPPLKYRDVESESRGPRRISDNYENDEVPEWVEDDIEDDPGTFDSSGMFVSMKMGRRDLEPHDKSKVQRENNENLEENKEERRRRLEHRKSSPKPDGQEKPLEKTAAPVRSQNGTGIKDIAAPPFQPSESHRANQDLDCSNGKQTVDTEHSGIPKSTDSHASTGSPAQLSDPDVQSQHSSVPTPESFSMPTFSTSSANPPVSGVDNETFLHMEKSLKNLIAEMTISSDSKPETEADVSKGALPLTHENANKWFYRDPQGEVQGPFKSEDMAQWFSAGYFTMSLIVKRGCDDSFRQLGELIKRYGRVPFLPGPPLPPLITSTSPQQEEAPQVTATPALTMPSLVPHIMPGLVGPPVQPISDPLVFQQLVAQQEYIKQQTYLMQQMQMQTLSKLQGQESFKALSLEQQQHLTMHMMQTNPLFMQQFQQLQHQMLLQQQQQQQQQQLVTQPQQSQPPGQQQQTPSSESHTEGGVAPLGPALSHPSANMTSPPSSFAPPTTPTSTPDAGENGSVWALKQQVPVSTGVWQQPSSLWDIDDNDSALNPAFMAQLEKKKLDMEEERLQEEERLRQEEIESKAEELRRQQDELERQREQVRREKEELERQKQLELQKLEEVRRQEEERLIQEIERQKQEQAERERIRLAEERKRQEEERKKEREMKKLEEKRRKEEEKRRSQMEQEQQELRRRKEEEEQLRQKELEEETRRQEELQRQIELEQLKEEEERIEREAKEKELQRKQQLELQRQQESMRKQQKEKLANIQLPASSNWAQQQTPVQSGPFQSKSLTEIQEEEAQREREKEREQQAQMQRMQSQAAVLQQQNLQKSWATHASHGIANRGLSLLDIQQQEQENARKSQKERERSQNHQAKIANSGPTSWTGNNSSLWGSQSVWDNSNTLANIGAWDKVPNQSHRKNQSSKESSEFPALKNPNQQAKKNAKSTKKVQVVSKQKKEEESVQKLFQNHQQDGFTKWVTERVSQFSAQIDVPTFVSFIVEVDNPDDVKDYVKTYLGETKECKDFARQFVEKRSQCRNQARLEKQLEEDSIWGPAPAVNPHSQSSGGISNSREGGGDSSQGKSAKSRKKKQKMQKLDGSVLGFTVHADPNRKNAAGELESIQ